MPFTHIYTPEAIPRGAGWSHRCRCGLGNAWGGNGGERGGFCSAAAADAMIARVAFAVFPTREAHAIGLTENDLGALVRAGRLRLVGERDGRPLTWRVLA